MNVDLMRKVDYFAGIPLCLLASLWVKTTDWLFKQQQNAPRRVLFVELSEMGSAILVDPAMRKMREVAGADLYFVIFKGNAASLRLLQTVPAEQVFTIDESSLLSLAVDTVKYLLWIRRQQIDTVIDLELFSRFSALLTGLSGASKRIGFHGFHNEGLYRGHMLTHAVSYNPHLHIAKNFIALVNAGLANTQELPFSKTLISDQEIRLAQAPAKSEVQSAIHDRILALYAPYRRGQRIVLINPNASDLLPQRRWMPDRFAAVIRNTLATFDDVLVLITGAPAEFSGAQQLVDAVGDTRCVNFAGQLKLDELPALYQISTLMLTNDSGPGHFSSITPLKTFVIFGPETPKLYGSLGNSIPIYAGLACSPCVSASNHRKTPCRDNVCLKVITAEEVSLQLKDYLLGA